MAPSRTPRPPGSVRVQIAVFLDPRDLSAIRMIAETDGVSMGEAVKRLLLEALTARDRQRAG